MRAMTKAVRAVVVPKHREAWDCAGSRGAIYVPKLGMREPDTGIDHVYIDPRACETSAPSALMPPYVLSFICACEVRHVMSIDNDSNPHQARLTAQMSSS